MSVSKMDFPEVDKLLGELKRAKQTIDQSLGGFSTKPQFGPSQTYAIAGSVSSYSPPIDPYQNGFGTTPEANNTRLAFETLKYTMDSVTQTLATVVDADIERLGLAQRAFKATDAENADRLLQAGRNGLDVFSTQLTSTGDDADGQRADQLRKLLGLTGTGNALVDGDLNTAPDQGSAGPTITNDYGQQGFDTHGGDIGDGHGGTSATNRPIDYVMPRGVGSSPAQRWNREQGGYGGNSDHDGQVVDVTMPDW